MRHQLRTKKFRSGKDANKMLLRKLSRNFFLKGSLTTTIAKAKALKSHVEHIVHLAKKNTESGKNVLLKKTGDKSLVILLSKQIAPIFKEKDGGYIRIVKIGKRPLDGSNMGRIEWTLPVVLGKSAEKKVKEQPKARIKKTISTKQKV